METQKSKPASHGELRVSLTVDKSPYHKELGLLVLTPVIVNYPEDRKCPVIPLVGWAAASAFHAVRIGADGTTTSASPVATS